MRKYGKFERMPDGTRAKPPKVKNVLLQTYFTSLLCMVLCVSMFFGTSYAWFTSEVNNVGNEIYIGTLKVGLYKGDTNLNGSDTKLFDKNIRWEPGYTALETIKVVNEGDLAFKYNLNFIVNEEPAVNNVLNTDATAVNVDAVKTLAANFEVWVFDHNNTTGTATPAAYEQITEANGWTPIGTLADVLNGKAVLENKIMETVRDNNADTPTNPGTTDGIATTDTYTIALHMKESATGEGLMGKKIVLNVKLVAYQMSKETGAFAGYDQLVMTPADLKEAMEKGGNVTLLSNIKLNESVTVPAGVAVNLNLNGHSITNTAEGVEFGLKNNGNLIVTGDGIVSGAYAGLYSTGTLIVNGGTFESAKGFGLMIDNIYGTEASVATINKGIFKGVGVYNPTKVTINDGTFNVGCDPDGATDHISDKMTLFVSPTFVGVPNTATVTLNGGTFNGDIYVYDDGITETVVTNNGATITGNVLTND